MSSSRANKTRFSIKSSEKLLMSSQRVAGAFASDNKSRTARRAGSSPMLRYKMRSAMGLRDLLTRSSGWTSWGHDRKVSMWSMSSKGRAISVGRSFMAMVVAAIWVRGMIRGGVGRLE